MKCNIISVLFTSFLVVSCAVRLTDNKKTVLKNELAEMVKIDQVAAGMPQGVYKEYTKEQWNNFKDSIFGYWFNIATNTRSFKRKCWQQWTKKLKR
ncbi:hypothetical protein SAMN05444410_102227 [Hydrobacter penzbergensis]|uniref:Lipoprotein n=1 Tax=Hydrobacter penzbergensis TaxID=1235997 RepID=A0A8X8ID81_9BACT|nr:hypothetical protein [Hydrobacter penzbergensis]SDW40710.1 hypothetical protein SAMN05444410_102227 [Hydrobacter penzbergensis]